MDLLQEIYDLSEGHNLAELISLYELESNFLMDLKYRRIYKLDKKIVIVVFDKMSDCSFELYFCENEKKLKLL